MKNNIRQKDWRPIEQLVGKEIRELDPEHESR